jgi:CheY-like chemotaxis protein
MALSRVDFGNEVANLYRNLYDLVYLRTHPLVDVLIPDPSIPRKNKGWQVHHLLLDVIEELNPGQDAPVFSRQWRRYQLLVLRYVDGLDPQAVADELTISRRQYFREQKAALETIAGILWDRCVVGEPALQEMSQAVEEQASLKRMELLRLEAARIGQASRYARVDHVVQGVLPLLQEMMHRRGLDIRQAIPEALPAVSVDRSLLRQMLLGMLGYLAERAEQTTLRLAARVEGAVVCISATVEPPSAVRPAARAEAEDRLSTLEELATLSGAHILPVRAEGSTVGFDMRLPAAQRTVLVVDDNEDVLELFRRYLSPFHYRIATARTAREALDQARELQPHAITLDLMMPDQDGWDVLQTLLNQPDTRHIPIIVCTVLKQKELALSLGATAFLEKPVSKQALLAALVALEET